MRCLPLAALALMLTGQTVQATTVTTISGGLKFNNVYYGYADGDSFDVARYHTPTALTMDSSGQYLFVADRDNNAIRYLDLSGGLTWTFMTNNLNKPVGVAIDANYFVYVLNQGNGNNGNVLTFDNFGDLIFTNATKLTNATAMAMDNSGNIYLTVNSNKLVRIAAGTANMTTIATINIPKTQLQGIIVKHNGLIAACDSGRNGIYLIDPNTGIATTNAGFNGTGDFVTNSTDLSSPTQAKFNQPMALAETGDGKLLVTDYGNNRVKVVLSSGVVSNLYGVTSQFWTANYYPGWSDGTVKIPDSQSANVQSRQPYGIVIATDGSVYTSEDYYELIRKVTGSGLSLPPPPPPVSPDSLTATANYGLVTLVWSASTGATNYNIKRSTTSGAETTIASVAGTVTSYIDTNVMDGTTYYYEVSALNTTGESANSAEASATPLFSATPTNLFVVTTNFGLISLSWASSVGATSYNIKRSPSTNGNFTIVGNTTSTSFNDTSVSNGVFYYYVVSALNNGGESANSLEVSGRAPIPAIPDPQIGYVDFPSSSSPVAFTSVFHPITSDVFNNDTFIVIKGASGSQTYYTIGTTLTNLSGMATNPPDPTDPSVSPSSVLSGYQDGISSSAGLSPYLVTQTFPDETIKTVSEETGVAPNSSVVQARIQFIVANPVINGGNAANFSLSDLTSGSQLYYTLDGSDPSSTNSSAVSLGVSLNSSNTWPLAFALQTNTLFKVRAFRANYQPSATVSNVFLASNFQPTIISFGFGNGEGSSAFVAAAGQTFYAPVTMSLVDNPTIYSLQFNLTVTNGVTNSGPPVAAGTFGFNSLLETPIPGVTPVEYEYIPPAMFVGLTPVPNPITYNGSDDFSSLLTTNTSFNLLGVGWVERAGETNLYNTTAQNLLTFSQAHDTVFLATGGKVIVGGFNIVIPQNAQTNQTYQIQIGRPSATSDGVGAPGSDVYISAPTNAGTGPGTVNALQYITVGQLKYIVGSTYPFRWFNAGDFGSSNIVSADVEQVFEAAVYQLNSPAFQAPGSDFFDTMDSSGNLGALDSNPADPDNGYYTNSLSSLGSVNPLFNGNDTTINQDVFGDGFLDVSDVYVTFRRSLDPTLVWYRRFWNNGQRVADIAANVANHAVKNTGVTLSQKTQAGTTPPVVNFSATDVQGGAGKTVQIPITATIVGSYPLRLLMLNLTVVPLDGSPALTTPVSFTQTATVLGAPYTTDSKGNGNYSSVWLNSTNSGLTGTVTIGTLNVTIPASATTNAAYAVHFDHASASPNGLASFRKNTLTGLVTTSSRTNSSYGDGIPDSWRLRWFGTIYNVLSVSNACPSGDGVDNWEKYIARVDPNTANDFPTLNPKSTVPSGYTAAIHWPTVNNRKYVIERSTSILSSPWTILTTNIGTGNDMEYDDNYTNKVKFYRVLILP